MNILCIDDSPTALGLYEAMLAESLPNDNLYYCDSGEAALSRVEETDYDVIITDLHMPGLSGVDLIEQISATSPDSTIIVVTGHASIESAVEAMRLGASDFLEKPVNFQLLTQKVEKARHYRSVRDEMEAFKGELDEAEENFNSRIRAAEVRERELRLAVKEAIDLLKEDEDVRVKPMVIKTLELLNQQLDYS